MRLATMNITLYVLLIGVFGRSSAKTIDLSAIDTELLSEDDANPESEWSAEKIDSVRDRTFLTADEGSGAGELMTDGTGVNSENVDYSGEFDDDTVHSNVNITQLRRAIPLMSPDGKTFFTPKN